MTPKETTEVVARIQVYDNRTVDQVTLRAWHQMLYPFAFDDAITAVEEFFRTEESEYLRPAHIIGRVKRMRSRRLERFGGLQLNYDDEFDEDDRLRYDATTRFEHLRDLVMNNEINMTDYKHYRAGRIALEDLGTQRPRREIDRE